MKAEGRLNGLKKHFEHVPSIPGLYKVSVWTYGTSYQWAVGSGDLYYNKTGYVGYSDYWNFDPKPSGKRPPIGEILTDILQYAPGKPFMVEYGIRPLDQYILRK